MKTIKRNENNTLFVNGHNCMSLIGKKHFVDGEFIGYCMFGVTTTGFPMLRLFITEEELNDEMTRLINSTKKFEEVL
jgi:hypothetical protein